MVRSYASVLHHRWQTCESRPVEQLKMSFIHDATDKFDSSQK